MFDSESRELLRLGREYSLREEYPEALKSFQAAAQFLNRDGDLFLQPQYLSHYGLALATAGQRNEGMRCCQRSIQLEPYEPEHYLNLGLVQELSGHRSAAFWAFQRGLAICPDHAGLASHTSRLDRRRTPPLPRLSRDHFLNHYLGKLLAAVRVRPRA